MAKPRRAAERPRPQTEIEREKETGMPAGRDRRRLRPITGADTTPRDVTGINPEKMRPIDPRMVYVPPA